ncbi:hypothetical protein SAMN05216349_1344 [Oribacterium sp. KHPX15]|uniref:hypothetical protein n=1 Tax=Oribacterium sp. KHPX15 TaxID=1855342 RepID=UPI00089A8409|nr:hypothetical protein [Oribacterium sp. KHPX15]SEA83305.1 hypothetical protein SAMN05216349_1344 [Oribacterium sp. KHPX15]
MIKDSHNGFHVFCQFYRNETWYYIDARGITTSFDEFIDGVKEFVKGEYSIRPVEQKDINDWEKEFEYNEEAYKFSEAVIKEYSEYYTCNYLRVGTLK